MTCPPRPPLALGLIFCAVCSTASCEPAAPDAGGEAPASSQVSAFLYVWAGAENEGDSDFLAVLDVDPASEGYGRILSSVPVGLRGRAHHSEHVMPAGDTLFVNAFNAGTTFLVDVSDPLAPRVAGSFREMGDYTYPHTFERLPNGNVLATFQTKGEGNTVPGGLVELDPAGRFVRAADAADPVDPELRAYSVTPVPELDRAVSTTGDMFMDVMGSSFQVWRLSDLTLLKTVRLPEGPLGHEHLDPAEVRLLADSTTAVLTTFTCSMYLLHDVDADEPWAELVHSFPWESYDDGDCGIPATRGRWWVQTWTHASGAALVSLDMSDPSAPVVVDELRLEELGMRERWWPHWISMEPEGDRIALTSGEGSTLYRVLMARLDPETGMLAWDETFREPGADLPGVTFEREQWPHGTAGPARPHGTVFARPGN